jgi:hypothetical protein
VTVMVLWKRTTRKRISWNKESSPLSIVTKIPMLKGVVASLRVHESCVVVL